MHFVRSNSSPVEGIRISARCPHCRQNGTFEKLPNSKDVQWINPANNGFPTEKWAAGLRQCPNPTCKGLLFFVYDLVAGNTVTYPPEVIDFDGTNLPANILSTLEEAIKCHAAECYRAAALMVRRTLEELCEDKGAKGSNLKKRIGSLSSVAVIPTELLSAADELRILGNDAAHVTLKDYDKVGKEESEIAIELAKELLKAVYQYSALLTRLKGLKSASNDED
ncbi:MAG: DUF4145 domain-containing protein [Roseibium sp.]|uniref:DUF4145 domain-containing protein n=1 Tax=Roseibium sp. TaxID=1936156 RepID=UPI001AFF6E8F|nr:DUF4145 domain-containing protein [Roseibium sp.]MBO6893571.1 DUF4145 domain-containing protein [Roseibium sp.]